jgi:DnaK suppressor protein
MPNQDVLARIRADLERERDELRSQLEEQGIDFDENFADSGQVAAEQGEHRALIDRLTSALRDVDRALAKLDDGSFGTCEVCGDEIPEPRLEAMPSARYCIKHA